VEQSATVCSCAAASHSTPYSLKPAARTSASVQLKRYADGFGARVVIDCHSRKGESRPLGSLHSRFAGMTN
jgi:hypothetical protein